MPLTRSFNRTVQERAARDPAFRAALFDEAINGLFSGDADTAKAALRAYINATIGFAALAKATGTPPKSLMGMLGPRGNPTAANFFGAINALQKKTGVRLKVRVTSSAA